MLLLTLGRDVQPTLEFSHVFSGVIGSCDHALALTSLRRHDQSRVPSLDRPCRPASAVLRTPRTPAQHDSPSPSAYRNRLRPTWAAETGLSCSVSGCVDVPSSIPRGCPASLPASRCSLLPSPWHERLGLPIPFRVLMSRGCKVHLSIGPANLLPSRRPYDLRRAFDIPLRRQALAPRPGPATRRSGAYRDGTLTRKSDTARLAACDESVRTHHW